MLRTYLTLSISFAVALTAQEFRSSIFGRVMDQQQAGIPGAKVVAMQVETGARTETVTGADGLYTLTFLLPGSYSITATSSGFKQMRRDGVTVGANERRTVDLVLEVGAVADSITVTAEVPLLEAATASVGQVVTQAQIENVPLNGRTPLALAQLAYGVIPQGRPEFIRPFDNGGVSDLSIAGSQNRGNELLMDGSPNATGNGRAAYSPPMDAVQELKVEAFQADAAYGNTGGGTVNVVTKGGTNQFHGTAWHFNQVSALAATNFFTNRAGQRKPVSRYNQWGFTSGGPIFIPKLVDGRNKLFYYFAYEGIRQPSPEAVQTTVPTDAMRRGDFSALLGAGSVYQLYDPLTGVLEGTRIRRQPLPGNIIPRERLNPIALKYLDFYPAPNQPGLIDGRNNYLAQKERSEFYDNEMVRVDYNISERHKMFGAFRRNKRFNLNDKLFDNVATGKNLTRKNWGATFDDVYTLNSTTVLNTRANWTRFTQANDRLSQGLDMTTLGFPAALKAASTQAVLPRIEMSPFNELGDDGGDLSPFDSFHILSTVTKIRGRHSFKGGVDLRLYRESQLAFGYSSGRYTIGSNWTRGPLDNSPSAPLGQELGSFMLGLPTGGGFDVNASRTAQSGYYAFFFQDDFRPTNALTLNLGLRYERETPTTERFDRVVAGYDFTSPNSITAAARAAYARAPIAEVPPSQFNPVGGIVFASARNRNIYNTASRNVSPRFGVAWTARRNTVLRAGYGIFFSDLGISGVKQPGFSQSTPFVATQNNYLTPAATLSNPFPSGILQPTGASLGIDTNLGRGVSFYNTEPKNPYSQRWNVNVQRTLPGRAMIEVGYLGNRAIRLPVDYALNFTPAQYLSTSPVRDQATIDRLSAVVANPFRGLIPGTNLNGATVSLQTLLQAYPQYSGVGVDALNQGSSYFHMLQVRVEKRFSKGFQILANYQWSKLMERRSRLNESDPGLEKRIAREDRPQRWVISGSWELPFRSDSRVLRQVIGGWVFSGIYSWMSGPPIEWGNVIYFGGDLQLNPRAIDRAFDTTRFNRIPGQQLGSNIRTFPTRFSNLREDGTNNFDLSAIKNFRILEGLKLQYRCEFFNAMNHANFRGPVTGPTNSAFGNITGQANGPRVIQMGLRMVW